MIEDWRAAIERIDKRASMARDIATGAMIFAFTALLLLLLLVIVVLR